MDRPSAAANLCRRSSSAAFRTIQSQGSGDSADDAGRISLPAGIAAPKGKRRGLPGSGPRPTETMSEPAAASASAEVRHAPEAAIGVLSAEPAPALSSASTSAPQVRAGHFTTPRLSPEEQPREAAAFLTRAGGPETRGNRSSSGTGATGRTRPEIATPSHQEAEPPRAVETMGDRRGTPDLCRGDRDPLGA